MTTFVSMVLSVVADQAATLAAHGYRFRLKQDETRRTAGVEIEGPIYVALIQVWEHAWCLDTTVLHLPTGRSTLLSAGPCETEAEAKSRLTVLWATLLGQE